MVGPKGRNDDEKREIVGYHKKHGRKPTMKKYDISDVTIYQYRNDLGLERTTKGKTYFGDTPMGIKKNTGAGIPRGGKTDDEKRAIIAYFDKYGPKPTCEKFQILDRSIYKYRNDLGLPALRGKGTKKRKYTKKYKTTVQPETQPMHQPEPEMLEIVADQRYEGTITLTIPNLKIRAKKVEVIQDE